MLCGNHQGNTFRPCRDMVLVISTNRGCGSLLFKIRLESSQIVYSTSPFGTSLCTGELTAIRKHKCFLCSPFYVKGVSLGYVGRNKKLKDLKGGVASWHEMQTNRDTALWRASHTTIRAPARWSSFVLG